MVQDATTKDAGSLEKARRTEAFTAWILRRAELNDSFSTIHQQTRRSTGKGLVATHVLMGQN